MAGFGARQEVIDRFYLFSYPLLFVQSFNLDVYFCFLFSALFYYFIYKFSKKNEARERGPRILLGGGGGGHSSVLFELPYRPTRVLAVLSKRSFTGFVPEHFTSSATPNRMSYRALLH